MKERDKERYNQRKSVKDKIRKIQKESAQGEHLKESAYLPL